MIKAMTEIFTAKKLEDAKKMAVETFGVSEDYIVFRILEQKKGLFSSKVTVEAVYEPIETTDNAIDENNKDTEEKASETKTSESAETVEEPIYEEKSVSYKENDTVSNIESSESSEIIIEEVQVQEDKNNSEDNIRKSLERAKAYIINVYAKMGVEASIDEKDTENGLILNVSSKKNNGDIIGHRGETLDAVQYLASIVANRTEEDYCRIMLDSSGYRAKRKVTLERYAEKMVKQVLRTGRAITLEAMNPYERRIIHSKVSEFENISSKSVGEDPHRKVVISSTKKYTKNGNNRNQNNRGKKPYRERRPEEFKKSSFDSMKTSFEKDYRKPRPEDDVNAGLYGKIEL